MQQWNQVELELMRRYVRCELSSVEFCWEFIDARDKGIVAKQRHEPVDFVLDDAWYDVDNHVPDEYVADYPEMYGDVPRAPGELDDEQLRESLARRLRDWDAGTYVPQYAD